MSITTVRLTLIEQAVAKLAAAKGPRISDMLREARARLQAGEPPPVQVYDVAELERQAAQGGIAGTMARARLRMLRGVASEALQTVRVSAVDGRGEVGISTATAPTGSTVPLATGSETVRRIDQLLAAHAWP